MDNFEIFPSAASLPLLNGARTRSISAENPTGECGKGGMAIPDLANPDTPHAGPAMNLGQGWKVRPFLKPRAGETCTLMDVKGPGVIQHIWITTESQFVNHGRGCVLRFYWDDEPTPSIEVPMTDFFAVGHDIFAPVNSSMVVCNPMSALNCYWPMPFRKSARVTFTNENARELGLLAFQITYAETPVPAHAGYLHAQFRKAVTDAKNPDYTIVDGLKGQGRYVGTVLSWTQLHEGWFGEGEIKFFMDGDKQFPTICGTGTEDYFCGTYGFPQVYTSPYAGCALARKNGDGPPKWTLYRWHVADPICYAQDLRVTIQALGWGADGRFRALQDDIASVAYWYQADPHAPFPALPALADRWPR